MLAAFQGPSEIRKASFTVGLLPRVSRLHEVVDKYARHFHRFAI